MVYDVVIIGGGASGLMLAANLDLNMAGDADPVSKCSGLILEKTSRAGTKLLMSGGGRCNITHGGSIKDFVNAYADAGTRLRRCLYRHSNLELAEWMITHGIPLADEHGEPLAMISDHLTQDDLQGVGRIFPASMKSADVLGALLQQIRSNGWDLLTDADVYDIRSVDAGMWQIQASPSETYVARHIVIACGGITYPETGSDGSIHEILRGLGISITPMRPALAPVYVDDYPYEGLSGISVPGVTVTAFSSDPTSTCRGKSSKMTGDLLFTHRGFSGPVILNISRYAEPGQILRISYGRSLDDLPRRLRRILEDRSRGPSGDIRQTRLTALLDHDDHTVADVDANGMVTAGGISLDDIDMKTMGINVLSAADDTVTGPSMYAVGESIDADGITGGYNLQMCWSTACTAADSIRDSITAARL